MRYDGVPGSGAVGCTYYHDKNYRQVPKAEFRCCQYPMPLASPILICQALGNPDLLGWRSVGEPQPTASGVAALRQIRSRYMPESLTEKAGFASVKRMSAKQCLASRRI